MSLKGKLIVLTWFDGEAILLPDLCNVIGCYTVNYPAKITVQHKADEIIVVTHNANFAAKNPLQMIHFSKEKQNGIHIHQNFRYDSKVHFLHQVLLI